MIKKNPKEHQSPFEKHFYRHLNNVQITLNSLNESIRSRRKSRTEQQDQTHFVKVQQWQNINEGTEKKQTNDKKGQKSIKVWLKIIFLVFLWVAGVALLRRPKIQKNIKLTKNEWDQLTIKTFARIYSYSNPFRQDMEKINQQNFEDYCILMKAQWLYELKPYYSSVIESQLNSLWKLDQQETHHFSIFDVNSTFISFHAFDIKRRKGVFSFKLNITFIQFNFKELQRIYNEKTYQELIDKQNFNHIYLQQNTIVINLFKNGILDYTKN